MKFIIPSFKRPKNLKTIKWLISEGVPRNDIYLILHSEEERQSYLLNNDLMDVNVEVTGLNEGIAGQRNFIMEKFFGEYIQLDDDIEGYMPLINKKFVKSPGKFIGFIEEAMEHCRKNNIGIFGVSPYQNGMFASGRMPMDLNKYFYGYIMGFNNYKTKVDTNVKIGSDVFCQLKCISDGRKTYRFNHHQMVVSHFKAGGCNEIRKDLSNDDLHTIHLLMVNNIHPEVIRRFGHTKLKKALKNEKWEYGDFDYDSQKSK